MTKREDFYRHAGLYAEAIRHSSQMDEVDHPSHKAIVAMGEDALPFIVEQMRAGKGHWFMAALLITGHNPVPPQCAGIVDSMRCYWVDYLDERETPKGRIMDNERPSIKQLTKEAMALEEPYFAAVSTLADARLTEAEADHRLTTVDINRRRAWDILVAARELIASESAQCYIRSWEGRRTTDVGSAEEKG